MSAAPRAPGLRLRDVGLTARTIVTLVLLTVASQLAFLAFVLVLKHIGDGVMDTRNGATVVAFAALYAMIVLVCAGYTHLRSAILGAVAERLGLTLRAEALQAAVRNAVRTDAAQAANAMREINRVHNFFASRGLLPFLDLIGALISIVVMFCIDTGLGLIGAGGAVAVAALGLLLHRATRQPLQASTNAMAATGSELSSQLSHPDLVRGLGLVPATLARWQHRYADALAGEERTRTRAKAVLALEKIAADLINIGAYVYVAALLLDQAATAGMLFTVYLLTSSALQPFSHVTQSWESWAGAIGAWRRLRQVMRQDSAPTVLPRDASAPPGLVLEGLTFHPARRAAPIIGGISLHLPPGTVCTVEGANGVGKSTLLRLVLGLLPPTGGRVLLDGQDSHRCDREVFGARIGYLPQDVQLLDADVFANIARGHDAAPETVVSAARAAGAHAMIGRLPLGYQTPAGLTSGLSAGQRRQVGLARALFGEPDLLVLDEPEVGLDGPARGEMRGAVARTRARGGVVLIVTHEPQTWSDVADIRLILGPGGTWEAATPRPAALQETGFAAAH